MASATAPKQGDHVFNAVDTALMRPFQTISSLRSGLVDGQHFIHDYLLQIDGLAREIARSRILADSRMHVATAGAEEDALREFSKLKTRLPALARVNATVLRDAHQKNAERFGGAAAHYETEFLRAVLEALEAVVAPTPAPRRDASPGIAYQQMLSAAYDPAAALVVITNSMSRETMAHQAAFHSIISALADTLDKPGMWRDPYTNFGDDRAAVGTRTVIDGIRAGLLGMDQLKARSGYFAMFIRNEIAQKASWPGATTAYGAMLHLLHGKLVQT